MKLFFLMTGLWCQLDGYVKFFMCEVFYMLSYSLYRGCIFVFIYCHIPVFFYCSLVASMILLVSIVENGCCSFKSMCLMKNCVCSASKIVYVFS